MIRLFLIASLLGVWDCFVSAEESSRPKYLKEILLGRCYNGPNPDACPAIVGSFMNAIESRRDADITQADFAPYLHPADFSSPRDKAVLYLRLYGNKQELPIVPNLVAPEDTPGGIVLRDLIFCGMDQRYNCSLETSNAYWKFWEAAYAKFAAQISGSLQIVLEPFADVQFLERSVLPYLDVAQISSVTVYGEDCNKIEGLLNSMEKKGLGNSICNSHVEDFYVDNLAKAQDEADSDEGIKGDGENGWNVAYLLLVIVVFSVASCWMFPTKTLKDLRTRMSSWALSFLLNPGELLRKSTLKSHEKRQYTEVDREVKTEDSALLT